MKEQSPPLSGNLADAAIYTLADELGFSAHTISWIAAGAETVSARRPSSSSHSSAREVCAALLRDLNEFYSGKIEDGLHEMRIWSSEDVGRVIRGLVAKRVIQAEQGEDTSEFDGLFRIDNLEPFLVSERISRRFVSWVNCKRYASWILYLVGGAVVAASYVHLVSHKIALIGWSVGMAGFALPYFPDPKPKRF